MQLLMLVNNGHIVTRVRMRQHLHTWVFTSARGAGATAHMNTNTVTKLSCQQTSLRCGEQTTLES